MVTDSLRSQSIYLSEINDDPPTGARKASRIELRTLRDAYRLKTTDGPTDAAEHPDDAALRRVSAFCTAEAYNLKTLHRILKETPLIDQLQVYFGECLFASFTHAGASRAMYFLHYGVVVLWGFDAAEEEDVFKLIAPAQENPYDLKEIEREHFLYGISQGPQIVNDKIFLSEDNTHTKMVISIAIAQSVKLDYFEELVDRTIETVKDLPDEVEKEGKVGKRRQDILKVMGRLHKLSFNLYLVSNILGEPEFIWEYSSFSSLYETCVRYMDIKVRADLLNKRCDIIHGILEILSENITTHNSEKLERTMAWLIGISVMFGFLQCGILLIILYLKTL